MSEAMEELEYVRLGWYEMLTGECPADQPTRAFAAIAGTTVSDCKVLYDSLNGNSSAGSGLAEKRSAIEVLALRQRITESQTVVRWVHSHAEVADGLTKVSGPAQQRLRAFLEAPGWKVVEDQQFESAKRRARRGLGILEYDQEKGSTIEVDPSAVRLGTSTGVDPSSVSAEKQAELPRERAPQGSLASGAQPGLPEPQALRLQTAWGGGGPEDPSSTPSGHHRGGPGWAGGP